MTTIELLTVIGILAVLTTLLWLALRPAESRRAAGEIAAVLRHARWSAVASGRPVVVLSRDEGRTLVWVPAPPYTCVVAPGTATSTVWEAGRRRVAVAWPVRGVAFGPDGFPRSCLGDGVGAATAEVRGRSDRAAVIVSSLGRVRWEVRQ